MSFRFGSTTGANLGDASWHSHRRESRSHRTSAGFGHGQRRWRPLSRTQTPTSLALHRRVTCRLRPRVGAERLATHPCAFDSRFFSGTGSRVAPAAQARRRMQEPSYTLTTSPHGARVARPSSRISRLSAADAISGKVLMVTGRANNRLQRTVRCAARR